MEKRVRIKTLLSEINQIKEKTGELKLIVDALPVSSVKDAFNYSVSNLEKKIEKFSAVTERMILSGEEKALISKFRFEKAQTDISQVPPVFESLEESVKLLKVKKKR